MKCDLCKRDAAVNQTLCETCADTIQRLLRISQRMEYQERPLAAKAARAG